MKKKITVIGLGYVGFPSYLLMLEKKLNVYGYDKNQQLLNRIKNGKYLSKEKSIQALYKKYLSKIKLINKLTKSDIFIICVPTPIKKNNKADLSFVGKAIIEINKVIQDNNTIIVESTCPPLTTRNIKKKLKFKNIKLAYCPERVFPGNTFNEMQNNTKIIGGIDKISTNLVTSFYRSLGVKKIIKTNDIEAEIIKLTENSYRDTTIAFANEISLISDSYKVDAKKIIKVANTHPRVSIPSPGIGVGGHCIPVDPYFLIENLSQNSLIKISRKINNTRPRIIAKKIKNLLNLFKLKFHRNPRILFLGKAYKPNIDDTRNSPAIEIYKNIKKFNRQTFIYDPIVDKKKISRKSILDYDLVIELVSHDEFKILKKDNKIKIVNF